MTAANNQKQGAGLAVVLLSGGLDSATALAMAQQQGFRCRALTIDYGQRHRCELDAACALAAAWDAHHTVVSVDLRAFGGSALTDANIDVPMNMYDGSSTAIPATYVPARNTIFLSLALAHAEVVGAFDLFIGANAVDFSGYPDCRPAFLKAFETLANLATRACVEGRDRFRIHAPLLTMSKAEIIRAGHALGIDFGMTHSCYSPDARGHACGKCDSCSIRARGFAAAGIADPTVYQE